MMRHSLFILLVLLSGFPSYAEENECIVPKTGPIASLSFAFLPKRAVDLVIDDELWSAKESLLTGVEQSLKYLSTPGAESDYQRLNMQGLSIERVKSSMQRFRMLLLKSHSAEEVDCHLRREFTTVKIGVSAQDSVRFTGYFQPIYPASRVRTDSYPYPIYRKPTDFETWKLPHPTRVALEGYDGKGTSKGPLRGLELAWFQNRYEAFMVGVQGSAILQLSDGSQMAVGYADGLRHPFVGIPSDFLKTHRLSYTDLKGFFEKNVEILNDYLTRNNRLVFFKENVIALPIGSLGVPVIPDRSIATDKSTMPPGALALINTALPVTRDGTKVKLQRTSRIMVDHDTGSAIKGPSRVDIFMGTGTRAQQKASSMYASGELAYLVLKEEQ